MRSLPGIVVLFFVCAATAGADEKLVLGWIEPVMLDPRLGLELEAKLDTGADTSSLDAHNIRRVRVGEKHYVRFTVRHSETGEYVELRKPYLRRVRIRRHGGAYQRRYVVRMQVCIGDRTRAIEVNLIGRAEFDYPMLLGRSALEGWSIIDPDLRHTTAPTCWTLPGAMPDDLAPNPPGDETPQMSPIDEEPEAAMTPIVADAPTIAPPIRAAGKAATTGMPPAHASRGASRRDDTGPAVDPVAPGAGETVVPVDDAVTVAAPGAGETVVPVDDAVTAAAPGAGETVVPVDDVVTAAAPATAPAPAAGDIPAISVDDDTQAAATVESPDARSRSESRTSERPAAGPATSASGHEVETGTAPPARRDDDERHRATADVALQNPNTARESAGADAGERPADVDAGGAVHQSEEQADSEAAHDEPGDDATGADNGTGRTDTPPEPAASLPIDPATLLPAALAQ